MFLLFFSFSSKFNSGQYHQHFLDISVARLLALVNFFFLLNVEVDVLKITCRHFQFQNTTYTNVLEYTRTDSLYKLFSSITEGKYPGKVLRNICLCVCQASSLLYNGIPIRWRGESH